MKKPRYQMVAGFFRYWDLLVGGLASEPCSRQFVCGYGSPQECCRAVLLPPPRINGKGWRRRNVFEVSNLPEQLGLCFPLTVSFSVVCFGSRPNVPCPLGKQPPFRIPKMSFRRRSWSPIASNWDWLPLLPFGKQFLTANQSVFQRHTVKPQS